MSKWDMRPAVEQLFPSLSVEECTYWMDWVETQPDYYITKINDAVCVSKVYNQLDPPWLRVAHEVAWWGTGRDAVRVLHRGMDWARLKGATHYGYSIAPHLDVVKWRVL